MTTSARQRTLERMKALVAFSASALASMSCQDGCGYAVVDPLPAPGGGFCSSFSAAFSVRVQSFSPPLDAGADEAGGIDASADDAGADDAGVEDEGGIDAGADAARDGGATDEAERPRRSTFVFIELRTGVQGVSLHRAPVELQNARGASILDVQSNDRLLAIEVDTTLTNEVELLISHDGQCYQYPMSPITLTIRLHDDGTVKEIRARTPNVGEEEVPNEL